MTYSSSRVSCFFLASCVSIIILELAWQVQQKQINLTRVYIEIVIALNP